MPVWAHNERARPSGHIGKENLTQKMLPDLLTEPLYCHLSAPTSRSRVPVSSNVRRFVKGTGGVPCPLNWAGARTSLGQLSTKQPGQSRLNAEVQS